MKKKNKDRPLIVIGGPTATGKTDLALSAAKILDCEIVNADSMQVYKGMDIGTNKDKAKLEAAGVKTWLFDVVEPDYNFTVSEYQKLAYEAIESIQGRGKVPILVGGTGLYIDAVIKGYVVETEPDWDRRKNLEKLSVEDLQKELEDLGFDLASLNNSDKNNPRRLIRLIEKQGKSGDPSLKEPDFDVLFLYPEFEIEELEEKIEKRVKKMIEQGLIKEVQRLLAKGYGKENKAMQAIGYKQVIEFLDSEMKNQEELIEKISLAHRQYAKRQKTWFEGVARGYDLVRVNKSTINLRLRENFGIMKV